MDLIELAVGDASVRNPGDLNCCTQEEKSLAERLFIYVHLS